MKQSSKRRNVCGTSGLPLLGIITGLTLLLAGCAPQRDVLVLDADEIRIPDCGVTALPVDIPVEQLDTDERPECRPVRATLVFPDGTRVPIERHAGTAAASHGDGWEYSYTDVGIYGLFVTRASPTCAVLDTWGSTQAEARVAEAFGEDYGCPAGTTP